MKGSEFLGWMGVKDFMFASRFDNLKKIKSFYEHADIVSNLLFAVNHYSNQLIQGCDLKLFAGINKNKYERKNKICFRMAKQDDYLSIIVDQIKSKYTDFIYFEDKRAKKLMQLYLKENKDLVDKKITNTGLLTKATFKGEFDNYFNNLKKGKHYGKEKYKTTVLYINGKTHTKNGVSYFPDKKEGFDVMFHKLFFSKKSLEGLIKTFQQLHNELFIKDYDNFKHSASFMALKGKKSEKYLIIEYKQKSKIENEYDNLLVLLKIRKDPSGHSLKKTIKDSIKVLKKSRKSLL